MPLPVSEIMIFPVKSLRGSALDEAIVKPHGLRFDRRWLVVDANDRFVTQRTRPRMALIAVTVQDGGLTLVAPGMPPLHVPTGATGMERRVTIWRDAVLARDVGDPAAIWLSAALDLSCRLVQMPESTERAVNPAYGMPGDIVSFADGYPFMLISQASLDDLNAHLPFPFPMRRFMKTAVDLRNYARLHPSPDQFVKVHHQTRTLWLHHNPTIRPECTGLIYHTLSRPTTFTTILYLFNFVRRIRLHSAILIHRVRRIACRVCLRVRHRASIPMRT